MKQIKKLGIIAAILAVCLSFGIQGNAKAAERIISSPGVACKSGKYIYYAYEMSGVRMGIMRYDTSTRKKKRITGYTYKGGKTNGFYDISISGKYLYVTWDQCYGTSEQDKYIYRINKKSGAKKRLASGECPVVAGKYVYYISSKYDAGARRIRKSICRMKLNGTSKRQLYTDSDIDRLYTDGNDIYYSKYRSDFLYPLDEGVDTLYKDAENVMSDKGEDSDNMLTVGNYQYYVDEVGSGETRRQRLYRKNVKTGKKNLVVKYYGISSWRVCGSYVMMKCYDYGYFNNGKRHVYCVSADGKSKKKLASWQPAE